MLYTSHMDTDPDDKPKSQARERFDAIYLALRERICLLDYAPGTRLGEEELAQEFGVSRTPLRRVLSRLESEGLLETRQGVGTFVTSFDMEGLRATYRLRLELASLIGRLDPLPPTPESLIRIRALIARLDAMTAPDPRSMARLFMEFYQESLALIGNPPLRDISERLYFLTHRIYLTLMPRMDHRAEVEVFRREMAETLAAMEIGDVEAVGLIRRTHISLNLRRMALVPAEDTT